MGLLAGRSTPRLQATLARLGSRLTFQEAVEEFQYQHHTAVGEATCRRTTYRHGWAAEALVCQEAVRLEREGLAEHAGEGGAKMVLSADGSFVRLITGEWREVKGLAIGEFATTGAVNGVGGAVQSRELSYFTRSYRVRDFETYALAEVGRRRLDQAETVVAVNDGAEWLQSFVDYHCPQAVRILDFAHALGHVAAAGKAVWGENSASFRSWFARCAQQLKHKPPQQTLADLRLLQPKAPHDEQATVLDSAYAYLHKRLEMMDYPFFQRRGYPIGSGAVESAHKQVVQRRLKGPGMRWAPAHLDPLLALRDLLANGRWQEGWAAIVDFQRQQRHEQRCQRVQARQPTPATPATFAARQAIRLLPQPSDPDHSSPPQTKPDKDPKDHPWRRNLWPTKESWRWAKPYQQK